MLERKNMTNLITEARELHAGWMAHESIHHGGGQGAKSDDGEMSRKFMFWLVDDFPELCDALEKANAEIDRLSQLAMMRDSEIGDKDREIERLREAQRWVSMSERFPTEKDADRLGFIIAHSDSMGQSTVCVWHHVLDDGVTSHWMPLPAPPEEGAEHE